MPKINSVVSCKKINIAAVLLLVFGLASCGSGGGGSTAGNSPPVAGGSANPGTPAAGSHTITKFSDAGEGKVTATSENSLTTGTAVTISGTENYNGTYTVVEATPGDFTVAAPFKENETGAWQLAGNIAAGCTTPGSGAITVANVPSRVDGVAPLSVFFDATGTTAAATSRPFHDLEYRWDFGDPAGGANWNAGSGTNSRNFATGAVAAHVFEAPGTYTVAVLATDGTNAGYGCTQIVVQDPDTIFAGANTICIGASSLPQAGAAGCPAGATTVQRADFVSAIQNYARSGKRVLFKRGDTFTAASTATLTSTGPGTIGAYGSGPAPVVQMTGNTTMLGLSSGSTPTIKDWRIMDLEFDGQGKSSSVGIETLGGINQVLVLNMNMHDINNGIMFNDSILSWYYDVGGRRDHAMFEEIAIVNSTISPIYYGTDGWRIFASAKYLAIQGNTLGNMQNDASMGSHVIRVPYAGKAVIANNTLARSGPNQVAIKLHGQAWCDVVSQPGTCEATDNTAPSATYNYRTNTRPIGVFAATSGYTEQVIVADNRIIGADSPYLVVAGPQNKNRDERIRDVIFERNWFQAGNGLTQKALVIHSYETTVRNNICDMTGGSNGATCFLVTLQGPSPAPAPDNIRIYNNTAYKGDASPGNNDSPVLVNIDTTSTNVAVQNNIAYAPAYSSALLVRGSGASGFVLSNNSTNAQIVGTFPGWINANPSVPEDFRITAESYARAAGLPTLPVYSDFFRANRSVDVPGIGAFAGP